jgi:hypothetical protein
MNEGSHLKVATHWLQGKTVMTQKVNKTEPKAGQADYTRRYLATNTPNHGHRSPYRQSQHQAHHRQQKISMVTIKHNNVGCGLVNSCYKMPHATSLFDDAMI